MKAHGFSKKRYRELLHKVARDYYDCSDSKTNSHPGFVRLETYCRKARSILDFGCGDGTFLNSLWRPNCDFVGVDVSSYAIARGRQISRLRHNIKLRTCDSENLPFGSGSFDLVYSAYVLEHVFKAEKCLREIVRVLKKGGIFVSIAPNYGSPIEFSPGFKMDGTKPLIHAMKLFLLSHFWQLKPPRNLAWNKVTPPILASKVYFPDSDVTNEPYVLTLASFLEKNGMRICEISSGIGWTDDKTVKINMNTPWRFKVTDFLKRKMIDLGKKGLSPYKYFGPTLFVVGVKK